MLALIMLMGLRHRFCGGNHAGALGSSAERVAGPSVDDKTGVIAVDAAARPASSPATTEESTMISIRIAYVGAFALAMATHAMAQDSQRMRTDKVEVVVETVARDLQNPWSIAFLPDSRMLVTERPGRLRIVSEPTARSPQPLGGVPKVACQGPGRIAGRGAVARILRRTASFS